MSLPVVRRPSIFDVLLALPLLTSAGGCASAYHDYPCGRVPYGYCAPPPLPYAQYEACPTPFANRYGSRDGATPAGYNKVSGPIDLATGTGS